MQSKLIILGHIHHLTPWIRPLKMFLTYFIKVDKREVLRLYFEHIHVLLLFLVFPGKVPLGSENE